MTERKEKTMLKWLKQKPTHGHGGLPIEKITDDPLATIQVHPHAKKSKNKANEIYAVSRVNPLFEEEDGKEVFFPGGHSGSSGYDSGSGPSDDDFPIITNGTDLKDLQANILGRLTSSANNNPSAKHAQLFINTENDVIHHEAAIVGPNGHPILQILEQNPNYVKSIALSVANGRKRPLSPISESQQQQQNPPPTTNTQIIRTSANTLSKISPIDAKSNSHSSSSNSPVDSVGVAKLVKKDSQFVKSIRIGAPSGSNGGTKRSILEANRRFSSSSSSSSNGPSRRPSVTFADDVGGGSRSGSRKPSIEQDSIVTESLLVMTSGGGNDARKFSNASNTSVTTSSNSRKTSVSSSQSKSQDENSTETDNVSETVDLEAFANSLRKSRPIKQLSSNNASRSPGSSDELDETSSSSSNPSEGYDSAEPPHEIGATLDRPTQQATNTATNPRIHTNNKIHKSPFGGIADHYAAAKEIAKEIESYSNGSAKASTKKSLVRDLLHRGNRNAANSISSNDISSSSKIATSIIGSGPIIGTNKSKIGFRGSRAGGGRDGTITKDSRYSSTHQLQDQQVVLASRTSPIYYETHGNAVAASGSHRVANTSALEAVTTIRGGSDDWELVRVQQVYVKAGTSYQDQQHHHQQPQLGHKQLKKYIKEGDSSAATTTSDSSGRAAAPQGQDYAAATTNTTISGRQPSSSASSSTTPKTTTGGKTAKKLKETGMGVSVDHLTVDYYYKNGYHESDRFYRRLSDNSSGISSGYDESASSDTSEGPDITVSSPSTPQPISRADDGLPAGARSRIQRDDDLDSGHSSDRIYTEVRLEIEGTAVALEDDKFTATTMEPDDENFENLPSKVMIVTGDSQNIVVDLSGVPLDLKNAIVSGTALITLPEGLDKLLQPGYTMITIPASNRPMSPQPPIHTQLIVDGVSTGKSTGEIRNNLSKKDGVMNITIGVDDDKPLVVSGSSNNSEDECKLFSTKNKTHIWDVMQHTLGKQHDGGGKKAKKKITTVFPFHPNQDAYESPDFTIEGHRLDRQRKKVEMEKKRRCACRLCGMLFFLVAFLGVLVALSMIYTKGQRYFGSV